MLGKSKIQLKNLIKWICLYAGICRFFSYLNRKKIAIVTFHQVVGDGMGQSYTPLRELLTENQFKIQINALSRFYTFITLDDAVDMISGKKPLEPYSLVITFDDGYCNNITRAYPILKQKNVPCGIYLTAALMENRIPMWVDRLDYAILHYQGEPVTCQIGGQALSLTGSTREQKAKSFKQFRRKAKGIPCDDREFLSAMEITSKKMEAASGKKLSQVWEEDDWSALLSWESIQAENRKLITYGGHTANHIRLTRVSTELAEEELRSSKEIIEKRTGTKCAHFAYPDGSYNDKVSELIAKCGYSSAVTTVGGLNSVGANIYQLKRLTLPLQSNEADVLAKVSGLTPFLVKTKRFLRSASVVEE